MRAVVLLGFLAALNLGCGAGIPSLRTEVDRDLVTVHFETLGEYPTGIGRIVLRDLESGRTVWEVRRSSGAPQLWKIELRLGENRTQQDPFGGGAFEVLVPQSASSFVLESRRPYALTRWTLSERRSKTTQFAIGAFPGQASNADERPEAN